MNLVFHRSHLILKMPQLLDPLDKFLSEVKGRDFKEMLKGHNFIVMEGFL